MSDDEKPTSWWQTLPGIITGLTATVTALAGLVVAVQQTGWLAPRRPAPATTSPAPSSEPSSASSAPSSSVSVVPSAPPSPAPTAPSPAPAAPSPPPAASQPGAPAHASARGAFTAPLPLLRDHKLGAATISFLKIEVAPRTTENDELRLRLRMTNHDRYDKNFWDQSFRLVLDGVPRAPESNLNEVVAGESAKEGDVLFVIPRGTTAAQLRIRIGDQSTEVPLELQSSS